MNPIVKRIFMGLGGFISALAAALVATEGGASLTLAQLDQIPLVSWLLSLGAFVTGFMNVGTGTGAKSKAKVNALMVLCFVPLLFACASVTTPATMEQQIFAAESSLPTIAKISTDLLNRGRITADQAKEVKEELDKARQAIEIAKISFAQGNGSTAESNLQAAVNILQALERALQTAQDKGATLSPDLVPA